MGKFNSAKSSKLFLESMEEDKNPERKRFNKLSNRVRRRLNKSERLTGDELEFVLSAVDEKTAKKLKSGESLDEFEKLMVIDVWMPRMRAGNNQGKAG